MRRKETEKEGTSKLWVFICNKSLSSSVSYMFYELQLSISSMMIEIISDLTRHNHIISTENRTWNIYSWLMSYFKKNATKYNIEKSYIQVTN